MRITVLTIFVSLHLALLDNFGVLRIFLYFQNVPLGTPKIFSLGLAVLVYQTIYWGQGGFGPWYDLIENKVWSAVSEAPTPSRCGVPASAVLYCHIDTKRNGFLRGTIVSVKALCFRGHKRVKKHTQLQFCSFGSSKIATFLYFLC